MGMLSVKETGCENAFSQILSRSPLSVVTSGDVALTTNLELSAKRLLRN